MRMLVLANLILAAWLAPLPSFALDAGVATVQVTSNGWHTGLVIHRADIPDGLLPELADFSPEARWFEFGWGSASFYPVKGAGIREALRAVSGSASVLHVVAMVMPVRDVFPSMEVVDLTLERGEARRLIQAIHERVERGGHSRAMPSYPGLYDGFSLFYPARGRFHLLATCNGWTLDSLREAGVATGDGPVLRAETVMERVRRLR